MKLTREADYAVRVVLDLAEHAGRGPVRSADIARRQLIPRPFLTKVVQALARQGYMRTHRGVRGGVTLTRRPREITMRAVVEAIEGPFRLNRCVAGSGECPLERRCPAHPVWRRLQALMLRELDRITFERLRRSSRRRGRA
ncbi:MAG: Rrf2 family transcriptional regulator [Armatimonadota bacterium]|nr:Rrf2 family transcriptional regulator [Armatimonadota bacterium]